MDSDPQPRSEFLLQNSMYILDPVRGRKRTTFHLLSIDLRRLQGRHVAQGRTKWASKNSVVRLLRPVSLHVGSPVSSSQTQVDGEEQNCFKNGRILSPMIIRNTPCNIARQETVSCAPIPSTNTIVAFSSSSVLDCKMFATHSQPTLVLSAYW